MPAAHGFPVSPFKASEELVDWPTCRKTYVHHGHQVWQLQPVCGYTIHIVLLLLFACLMVERQKWCLRIEDVVFWRLLQICTQMSALAISWWSAYWGLWDVWIGFCLELLVSFQRNSGTGKRFSVVRGYCLFSVLYFQSSHCTIRCSVAELFVCL